jgi:hypothetical protein
MVTPGSTPPVSSLALPAICAFCANACDATQTKTAAAT